ncbi:AN1-type zinc finger protein 3, partial [Sigmodon hispidus]
VETSPENTNVATFFSTCQNHTCCLWNWLTLSMTTCPKAYFPLNSSHPQNGIGGKALDGGINIGSERAVVHKTRNPITNLALTSPARLVTLQILMNRISNKGCGSCRVPGELPLHLPRNWTQLELSCRPLSDSQSENEASPVKRPRLLESTERPEENSRSKQKSRRRCFQCQTKLELVQQELGSCRCGYVFCMLHRLPEQHDCTFDHMGRGREEAIMKMVKLDRKVGRSCQRIGEGCS